MNSKVMAQDEINHRLAQDPPEDQILAQDPPEDLRRVRRSIATVIDAEAAAQDAVSEATYQIGADDEHEAIPSGSFSAPLGYYLSSVKKHSAGSRNKTIRNALKILLLPPIIVAVTISVYPFVPPNTIQTPRDILANQVPYNIIVCFLTFPGFSYINAHTLAETPTLKYVFLSTCLMNLGWTSAIVMVATVQGRYPVPYQYLYSGNACMLGGFHSIVHFKGWEALRKRENRKKILPLLMLMMLCLGFLVVFSFFRALFSNLDGRKQTFLAPLWPLIKLGE